MKENAMRLIETYIELAQKAENNLQKAKWVGEGLGASEMAHAMLIITDEEHDKNRDILYAL